MNYSKVARRMLATTSIAALALCVSTLANAQEASTSSNSAAQPESSGGPQLETVTVTAEKGFGSEVTQLGGFRGAHIIDTPASIIVLPKDVLDAQQATSMSDILKNIAGANSTAVGVIVTSNASIRGIPLDNRNGYRMDGSLPFVNLIEMPIEDKERVEFMKGAAGLYYGFASPAGVVNVTMKRPTLDPLLDAKIFGNQYGAAGVAVDFGNTVGDGKFGYRINAVLANENPGIGNEVGTRSLLSGAFDINLLQNVSTQIDIEHIYKNQPFPASFRFATLPTPTPANPYPALTLPNVKTIDPSLNFGLIGWSNYRAEETNVLMHNVWSITPAWEVSVDVGDSKFSRYLNNASIMPTNLATGDGTLRFQFSTENSENRNVRFQTSGAFETFGFNHNATIGWQLNQRDDFTASGPQVACAGGVYTTSCQTGITSVNGVTVNYLKPGYQQQITPQAPPVFTGPVDRVNDSGLYVFDRITWKNYVEISAGGRFGNYGDSNIKPVAHQNYHAAPATTSESVVLKPFGNSDLSIYASYVEALESLQPAPGFASNAGQLLNPLPSAQREVGVKSEIIPGLLLTADYFNIHRGSAFVNASNLYVEDGQAKYEGFEVSASGSITDKLSISANGILMMAKQISGAPSCGAAPFPITPGCTVFSPTTVGLNISNVAKNYGSVFAEYKLDDFVDGLAVNGGIFFTGTRPLDSLNEAFLASFFTVDLGASYSTIAFEYPVTFRVEAKNVGNVRYWASGDFNIFAEGPPESVFFSLESHL